MKCRKKFSVRKSTVMEDSAIGLDKWLIATWLIVNSKNGTSSYELQRSLRLTQKTSYFLSHHIRLALQEGTLDTKLMGKVQVDETYIGGKARNMHKDKKLIGTGGVGKEIVLGLLEAGGKVQTKVIPNIQTVILDPEVRKHIEKGSEIHSDTL